MNKETEARMREHIVAITADRDRLREALTYWLPKERPFEHGRDPVCIAHRNQWDAAYKALEAQ